MTEKETGNAQPGACVDVLPQCWLALALSWLREWLAVTMLPATRAWQIMANPKWRRQAKNATSAKILEEMKKSVGNRLGFFNQRLPSNT